LEVGLLADLFKKGQPHGRIVERNVTRPKHFPALFGGVRRAQADRQKTQRAAGALEVRYGRPSLAHQVN
jgi:hypothetical protein